MAIGFNSINFFMPVFSFLFVFIVVYSVLAVTNVLKAGKYVNLILAFILSIVFMSVSSMDLYVQTIIPWFVVLVLAVFFVLIIASFSSSGDLKSILTSKFAWAIIGILLLIFIVAAIKVFNPVFHPELGIAEGAEGESIILQVIDWLYSSKVAGSVLLVIAVVIVSWVLVKTK